MDWEGDGIPDSGAADAEAHGSFVDRMLEVLRRSPVVHVGGGKIVTLRNVRSPAKTLSLSAEAVEVNGEERPVAFAIQPDARLLIEKAADMGLPPRLLRAGHA